MKYGDKGTTKRKKPSILRYFDQKRWIANKERNIATAARKAAAHK